MATPSSSARRALADLGARLREIRVEAQLTGRDLANAAGWHSSKVSRIEYGKQAPSADDIRVWCTRCDATSQTEDVLATLRTVEGMYVEWWRLERNGFRSLSHSLDPLWERTRQFRIYNSQLVPGPLQAPAYLTTVLSGIRNSRDVSDDVAATVRLRLERQRCLYEGNHRFAILLEESVLHWPIGGVETMTEQLRHLREAATLPSVALGIIPLGADRSTLRLMRNPDEAEIDFRVRQTKQ